MFRVRAPTGVGTYGQFFGLVHGTAWFSDPGQGGPGDMQLQLRVTVAEGAPIPDASVPPTDSSVADAGPLGDAGPFAPADASGSLDGGNPFLRPDSGTPHMPPPNGCGCRVAGPPAGSAWLVGLFLLALGFRRRRG